MAIPRLSGTFRDPQIIVDAPDSSISQFAQLAETGLSIFGTIEQKKQAEQVALDEARKRSLVDSLAESLVQIEQKTATGAIDSKQAELQARSAFLEASRRADGDKEVLSTLATTFKNLTGFDVGGFQFSQIKAEKERAASEEKLRRENMIRLGFNPDDNDDVALFNQTLAAANAAALTKNLLEAKQNQQKLAATEVYNGFLSAAQEANATFGSQLLKASKAVGGNLNNLSNEQKQALFETLDAAYASLEAQIKSKASFYRDLDENQRKSVLELLSVNKNAWRDALTGKSTLEFAVAMNNFNNAVGEYLYLGTPQQVALYKQMQEALGANDNVFMRALFGNEVTPNTLKRFGAFLNRPFGVESKGPVAKIAGVAIGSGEVPLSGNKEDVANQNKILENAFRGYKDLADDDREVLTNLFRGLSVSPNNVGLKTFESITDFVENNADKLKLPKFQELRRNISELFGKKLGAITDKSFSEVDSNFTVVVRGNEIVAVPVEDERASPDAVGRFDFPENRKSRADAWNRKYGGLINRTLHAVANMTGKPVEEVVKGYAASRGVIKEEEFIVQTDLSNELSKGGEESKAKIDKEAFNLLLEQVGLGGLDKEAAKKVLLQFFSVGE